MQTPAPPVAVDWAKVRIGLTYLWRHRRICDLAHPHRFTEPVQVRKRFDRDIPRGLLAEPMIGGGGPLPTDYKIYVFGGRATHVQVHVDRERRHRWILHDRDWRPLVRLPADRPARPHSLKAMLEAAEVLAGGLSFARVDFYEDRGRPLFGEFSFYPGSGLDPFAEDWIDFELGSLWRAALADQGFASGASSGANAPPGTADAIGLA